MSAATATAAGGARPSSGGQTSTTEAPSCGRCGHALHPDEPVWLQRCGRHLTSVCWRCQNEGAAYWPERPCGNCQRPVYAVSWAARADTVVFCSKSCRSEGRTAVIRQCATCGKGFATKRNDAVTCSSKCRQKAYRQRGVTDDHRRTARPSGNVTDNRRAAWRPPNSRNGNLGILA